MNSPRTVNVVALDWPPGFSATQFLFTPVDTVREVYARFARRDFAGVFELLALDVEIAQTTALTWGGRFRGHRGSRVFFSRLTQHTDAISEPFTYIAAGDDVAVVGRYRGRARSTGQAFDVDFVHIWTVRAGRMTRCVAFVDTPAIRKALGIG